MLRSTGFSLNGAVTGLGQAIAGLVIGFMTRDFGFDVSFFWAINIPTTIATRLFFFHYPTYGKTTQQIQDILAKRREAALEGS